MFKRQSVLIASLALAFAAKPGRAQVSRLPEPIQKKLAEINPLYQSNIRKYGPQTIELFTPLLAAGPKDGVSVTADQAYGTDPQQTLDVYQPRGLRIFPSLCLSMAARSRRETRTRTRRSTPMFSTILRATSSWASMPTTGSPQSTSIRRQPKTSGASSPGSKRTRGALGAIRSAFI